MNAQLNYILAQQRIADLQRAADHARLATDVGTRRRDSRHSNPIVRALPMPDSPPIAGSLARRQPAFRRQPHAGPPPSSAGRRPKTGGNASDATTVSLGNQHQHSEKHR